MRLQNSGSYTIFLSDASDGPFFLDARLPVFIDWTVPTQTHGNTIIHIDTIDSIKTVDLSQADGIISCITGVVLGVKLADCNGIIIAGKKWYAVIHAGWKWLQVGILEKTLEALKKYGEPIEELSVFCSPSIRACCYEVGDEFLQFFPDHCILQENGRYHFDAIGYIQAILEKNNIPKNQITINPTCTSCKEGFYSYRRDKTEQRFVFWIRKNFQET